MTTKYLKCVAENPKTQLRQIKKQSRDELDTLPEIQNKRPKLFWNKHQKPLGVTSHPINQPT